MNLWEAKAMRKRILTWLTLPLFVVLFGFGSAESYTNFGFGLSVGNYDYLPYGHSNVGVSIDFNNYMGDYGNWVNVPRFGRCWRPYATSSWRPYLYGHWDYTSYGPTWEGYEPWAWAGYHYGNWIFTPEYGWVWIPGYDWHPDRVTWGYDSNAIGWMPSPPVGYSYGCGYLSYGDCGYSDPYYSPRFSNIGFNLFVFIDRHRFFNDNYADYYLGRDYTRNVFVRRSARFEQRPIQRAQLERILGQRVNEVPVRVRDIRMHDRVVKAVIPEGSETRIRRNADRVIKQTIAPAIRDRRNFDNDFERSSSRDREQVVQHPSDRNFDRNADRNTIERRDFRRNSNDRDRQFDNRVRGNERTVIQNDRGRERTLENRNREQFGRDRELSRDRQFTPDRSFDARQREQQIQRDRQTFDRNTNNRNERERIYQGYQRNENPRYDNPRRIEEQRNIERRDIQQRDLRERDSERRNFDRPEAQPRFEGPDQRVQPRTEGSDRSNRDNQVRRNDSNKKDKPKKPHQ
jgi:hypothetical protein